jgi:hypothetical protein
MFHGAIAAFIVGKLHAMSMFAMFIASTVPAN